MDSKYALISVFNKEKIVDFAKGLEKLDVNIISTGGTADFLKSAGIRIKDVTELTGFPEMLNGRVKSLHPKIHAGILARRENNVHMNTLKNHDISPIDIVVCNLYPFEQTIKKSNVGIEEVIENIDIGGPTLIRAAAKNYNDVIILTNPEQYKMILDILKEKKEITVHQKKLLAIDAYSHTAKYDSIISTYLRNRWTDSILPENCTLALSKIQDMRYGENIHQKHKCWIKPEWFTQNKYNVTFPEPDKNTLAIKEFII